MTEIEGGQIGVLPDVHLRKAIEAGHVSADPFRIPERSVQPASLDLTLGRRAYRLRCSFLPDTKDVADKLAEHSMGEVDLRD